jgi:hypothetical protein
VIAPAPASPHTDAVHISATLNDGTVVAGKLWMHPSRRGSFEVEYGGERHTDGRSGYRNEAHIRAVARILLRDLAEGSLKAKARK